MHRYRAHSKSIAAPISAHSIDRGIVGFLENELTLTIGLGALSELTLSELGALIAADVGHYTNTFDTRLFYCITALGTWLKRSAEDQDNIDAKIALLRNTAGNVFIKLACSHCTCFISTGFLYSQAFPCRCAFSLQKKHAIARFRRRQLCSLSRRTGCFSLGPDETASCCCSFAGSVFKLTCPAQVRTITRCPIIFQNTSSTSFKRRMRKEKIN